MFHKVTFLFFSLKPTGKILLHEITQLQPGKVHIAGLVAGTSVTCSQAIPMHLPVCIYNLLDVNKWRMASSVNRRPAFVLRVPGMTLES